MNFSALSRLVLVLIQVGVLIWSAAAFQLSSNLKKSWTLFWSLPIVKKKVQEKKMEMTKKLSNNQQPISEVTSEAD